MPITDDAAKNPQQAMNYRKFFVRGEKRLSSEQGKAYSTQIPVRGTAIEDVRLNNLYRDCFSIHVTDYFGAPTEKLIESSQEDRLVAADNITARFIKEYYTPPKILPTREAATESPQESVEGLDLDKFVKRISTNPIDACTLDSLELGTNKVTYLIGDVGLGKSTFIARMHLECSGSARDSTGYRVIPVVYDFEARHKDGERLKAIGEEFWADLYTHIYQTISSRHDIAVEAGLDAVVINPRLSDTTYHPFLIHYLRQLIHHLARRKIRLVIVFDNLDRYHFRYTKMAQIPLFQRSPLSNVFTRFETLSRTLIICPSA